MTSENSRGYLLMKFCTDKFNQHSMNNKWVRNIIVRRAVRWVLQSSIHASMPPLKKTTIDNIVFQTCFGLRFPLHKLVWWFDCDFLITICYYLIFHPLQRELKVKRHDDDARIVLPIHVTHSRNCTMTNHSAFVRDVCQCK